MTADTPTPEMIDADMLRRQENELQRIIGGGAVDR